MQKHEIHMLIEPNKHNYLLRSCANISMLSPFQRILMTTDGTLTKILESYLLEPIQIVKLSEKIVPITKEILPLNLKVGSHIIKRKVLLQSKINRKNLIYAESIFALEKLDKSFKNELLSSKISIGKLWLKYQLETFKEIISSSEELAQDLSDYFPINKKDKVLSRTYRVFSNNEPIIMITEKFPINYFLEF